MNAHPHVTVWTSGKGMAKYSNSLLASTLPCLSSLSSAVAAVPLSRSSPSALVLGQNCGGVAGGGGEDGEMKAEEDAEILVVGLGDCGEDSAAAGRSDAGPCIRGRVEFFW